MYTWDVGPKESNPHPHLWYNPGLVLDHFILGSLINWRYQKVSEGIRNILGAGICWDYIISWWVNPIKSTRIEVWTYLDAPQNPVLCDSWSFYIILYHFPLSPTPPTYHKATFKMAKFSLQDLHPPPPTKTSKFIYFHIRHLMKILVVILTYHRSHFYLFSLIFT